MADRFYVPPPDYEKDYESQAQRPVDIPSPDYGTIKVFNFNPMPPRLTSPTRNAEGRFYNKNSKIIKNKNSRIPSPPIKETIENPISNGIEYKIHSYIEDHIDTVPEASKSSSIIEHVKHVGVPVLPPLVKPADPAYPGPIVSNDQNKAYLKHLENHSKFDTVVGIGNCEVCRQMRQQLNSDDWSPNVSAGKRNRNRTNVRDLFELNETPEEPQEPAPSASNLRMITKKSYEKQSEHEISVVEAEKIEILRTGENFVLCEKSDGSTGWLPNDVLGIL